MRKWRRMSPQVIIIAKELEMLIILASANHNKDHSVMIFTRLDVLRGIFISANPNFKILI